ncbi:MAG: S41 family peptidase [Pseudoflavonifractor sp.]|nr:S41 family peptidase [Alloprevotella sp.]MCM1116652.1 S41 family peptidase [Pseudoflavonifractor sp.]
MKKIDKRTFITAMAMMAIAAASAATPMWLRDVRISPDGSTIAFTYKGDIFTVPAKGGSATRLTTTPSYESHPIWSPNGKQIAFASDRNGGREIFIMPAKGGTATRLTSNSVQELPEAFTPDGKELIFSAAIQDPASSADFPTSRRGELYAVPVAGGRPRQLMPLSATAVEYISPKGDFVYEEIHSQENIWRKHHTSSATRDIWAYNPTTKKHVNLTDMPGEDRSPAIGADGRLYFLSERNGGSMNVYSMDMSAPSVIKKETSFDRHPVRFLSAGSNGLLAYAWDGEIYTQTPGGKPQKVNIDITMDETNPTVTLPVRGGRGVPSPDGKMVAFTNRGEVFVTSVDHGTTKQITHTPEGECDLAWGKDSRELYYVSERDGRFNIYRATIRPDDPNFANATVIKEEPVFKADKHERTNPAISPDGKKMAYVIDRNNLMVMDIASGKTKKVTNDNITTSRGHGFSTSWSPDSRYILLEQCEYLHEPYTDIAIIDSETGEMTKVTASGYFDQDPKWALDGNAIVFGSERYGMRNHASWGSQGDVMMAFLNRDAYDRYRLSEEDYELLTDAEKKAKKDETKKDAEKKEEVKPIVLEADGIRDRIVRLTPASADISDFAITPDGKYLYFIASSEKGSDLWKKDLRKGDIKVAQHLSGRQGLATSRDGSMFLMGRSMSKLDPKTDKITPISVSTQMTIDPAAERQYMYDYMRREARERFLWADMGGVDWEGYVDHYSKFLPHIANNPDFADLMSEVLGELNVSHSGGRYTGPSANHPYASLGLLYNLDFAGPGLKVDEVIVGGPFDRAASKMAPGSVITAINGEALSNASDPLALLSDATGHKTLVSFTLPSGEKIEETVLPISQGAESNLLYERWVKARKADVERLSGGRLGYVHIRSMGDPSFRDMYSQVLGEYVGKDGIVIDTRWNGGGRLHEDIEVMFSGKKYFHQELHGRRSGDMPSRRWNKPSIMIIGEGNYSNAHGTPWVYKHLGLGKLVGMPVPGTMSSVNWITLQDPQLVFGVPVTGYKLPDGSYLENQQLEPDIKVANDADVVAAGTDQQLEAAVKALLKDIDEQK